MISFSCIAVCIPPLNRSAVLILVFLFNSAADRSMKFYMKNLRLCLNEYISATYSTLMNTRIDRYHHLYWNLICEELVVDLHQMVMHRFSIVLNDMEVHTDNVFHIHENGVNTTYKFPFSANKECFLPMDQKYKSYLLHNIILMSIKLASLSYEIRKYDSVNNIVIV